MKATGIVLAIMNTPCVGFLLNRQVLTSQQKPLPSEKWSRPSSCLYGLRSRLGPESNLNPRAESEIICYQLESVSIVTALVG